MSSNMRKRLIKVLCGLVFLFFVLYRSLVAWEVEHRAEEAYSKLGKTFEGSAICSAEGRRGPVEEQYAIMMDSLRYDKLRMIGGTGHWFHLLERLLPLIRYTSRHVWTQNGPLLYIVFREEYGARELDAFGRLMLTAILTGGYFGKVVIGYSEKFYEDKDRGDGSWRWVAMEDFQLVSTLQIYSAAATSASSSSSSSSSSFSSTFSPSSSLPPFGCHQRHGFYLDLQHETISLEEKKAKAKARAIIAAESLICARAIYRASWNQVAKKRYNMAKEQSTLSLLFESVGRYCSALSLQMKSTSTSSLHSFPEKQRIGQGHGDELSAPANPRFAKKILKYNNGSFLAPVNRSRAEGGSGPVRIVIYQRDLTRGFEDVQGLAARLQKLLSLPSQQPSQQPREFIVEIVTHSATQCPCELIAKIHSASVLFTPHGFQSILLLFQPPSSLLVEVHPALYFKPEIFGFVQAGVRNYAPRSYLSEQSKPTVWLVSFLSHFISSKQCTAVAVCRHLARNQPVVASDAFITRVSAYILFHYY